MSGRKKRILVVAVVLLALLLLVLCGCVIGYLILNLPLGPTLQMATPTMEVSADSHPTVMPTNETPAICGTRGSINILIMGVDSPFEDGHKGPLAIRLVKVDFTLQTADIFSFPRDLWVPVKGLENLGIDHERLGRLFLIARDNAGYSDAEATRLVAQTLFDYFGAYSDHYITGKMSTLVDIIDTVDGITVTIPVAHDATSWGMHYFPAGPYHLNGLLAMEYAITPTLAGQWDGWDRQSLVLYALFQKILSPDTLTRLPELIPLFLQAVATDLSMQQMLDLACISQKMHRDRTVFAEVAPEDVTFGPDGVQYPNVEAVRTKVIQRLTPNTP